MKIDSEVLEELEKLKPIIANYKYFREDADLYVEKIKNEILKIENLFFHAKSKFNTHKKYGDFVHSYRANRRTTWYIIYNIDRDGDITIKKIMKNYMTVSGISGLQGTRNNNIIKTLLLAAGIYALYKITSK